jgi:hypothetical protein
MVPNIHIHEQLMFEHVRERQRYSDQQRLLAHLHTPLSLRIEYLLKSLSALFSASGSRPRQLEQGNESLV